MEAGSGNIDRRKLAVEGRGHCVFVGHKEEAAQEPRKTLNKQGRVRTSC